MPPGCYWAWGRWGPNAEMGSGTGFFSLSPSCCSERLMKGEDVGAPQSCCLCFGEAIDKLLALVSSYKCARCYSKCIIARTIFWQEVCFVRGSQQQSPFLMHLSTIQKDVKRRAVEGCVTKCGMDDIWDEILILNIYIKKQRNNPVNAFFIFLLSFILSGYVRGFLSLHKI